jgi:Uma2 family endonuclease
MGTTTETPLLTFEEFERLPDQPGKRELLRGELIELPPADFLHTHLMYLICKILDVAVSEAHARGAAPELGAVYPEMGYLLPGAGWVKPDVSVTHAGQLKKKYLQGAPAIAIELVSAGNLAAHVAKKTDLYFQFGAREVWWIYPDSNHAMIHTGSTVNVRIEQEAITTPLLPAFSLNLKEILAS